MRSGFTSASPTLGRTLGATYSIGSRTQWMLWYDDGARARGIVVTMEADRSPRRAPGQRRTQRSCS